MLAFKVLIRGRNTYLTGHVTEPRGGDITADDALSQSGVVLVLEIHEERSNLGLVFSVRAVAVLLHFGFDSNCTLQDQVRR